MRRSSSFFRRFRSLTVLTAAVAAVSLSVSLSAVTTAAHAAALIEGRPNNGVMLNELTSFGEIYRIDATVPTGGPWFAGVRNTGSRLPYTTLGTSGNGTRIQNVHLWPASVDPHKSMDVAIYRAGGESQPLALYPGDGSSSSEWVLGFRVTGLALALAGIVVLARTDQICAWLLTPAGTHLLQYTATDQALLCNGIQSALLSGLSGLSGATGAIALRAALLLLIGLVGLDVVVDEYSALQDVAKNPPAIPAPTPAPTPAPGGGDCPCPPDPDLVPLLVGAATARVLLPYGLPTASHPTQPQIRAGMQQCQNLMTQGGYDSSLCQTDAILFVGANAAEPANPPRMGPAGVPAEHLVAGR